MWELDHKEDWTLKNWCFRIEVLEKTLGSPLDCKEIKPANSKGNQPWIFTGRTDAEAPILWPPDLKSQFTGKDPDAGKDWGQEDKGATKDEMVGWHHRLNGHGFEQTLGNSEGHRAWHAAVYGASESWTWLSDWTTMNELQKVGIEGTYINITKGLMANSRLTSYSVVESWKHFL